MKRIVVVGASLVLAASVGYAGGTAAAAGSRYLAAPIVASAGSITGIVRCGEDVTEPGAEGPKARPWSTVWVQGHSYSARADGSGAFVIDYVPPGEYTLGVQTAGMPIRSEFPGVIVQPRTTTDVGFLDVTGGCGQCGRGGGDTGGGCEGDEGGSCG